MLSQVHPVGLRDELADERLHLEGWAVVDLLSEDQLRQTAAFCDQIHSVALEGWECDFFERDPAVKQRIHDTLGKLLSNPIERAFDDHRSLLRNFVVNWPGPDGGIGLHQHSSVVDERRFRSYVVWVALDDATEANGTLHLVPRSHLVQCGPRPERSTSWAEVHRDLIVRDHLQSVPLKAGQAIVFDNQLLHCSFANTTARPRRTAVVVVIPNAAEPHFYEALGSDRVRVHRLHPQHFIDNVAGDREWAPPDGLEVIEELAWTPTVVEPSEVAAALIQGTCAHDDG